MLALAEALHSRLLRHDPLAMRARSDTHGDGARPTNHPQEAIMQAYRIMLALGLAALVAVPAAHAARYTTTLAGNNENPPNASAGTGTSFVELDTATHVLRVNVAFAGLTGTTTAAHVHCCTAPPGNVGVATQTPSFIGFPLGVTSGAYDQTFDTTQASTWNAAFVTANGGTPAGAEAALAAGLAAGQAYLNVHSSSFPGGEIRGFLALDPGTSTIPTLSQWGMIALVAALALAAAMAMRRRRA
jgi:hypothetical protein